MQNAGIAALKLDWRYLAFDVHPSALQQAIDGAKAMRFVGLNLTVPHKILAFEMMDVLDPSAQSWGAVNTVRFETRRSPVDPWEPIAHVPPDQISEIRTCGFNTDADAIVQSLADDLKFTIHNCTALVLGAGGAGRVAALKLAASGAKQLFLVNRTQSKAKEIAHELSRRFPALHLDLDYPKGPVDLVLNATSVGLQSTDLLPFEPQRFDLHQARCAYDMIYRPATTPFLAAAQAAGCQTANGLGMLLHQGAAALHIWSGKPPPINVMRRALAENVYV